MSAQSQDQPDKVAPLWQSVVGDTEPWRRGRLFLILVGVVTFCFQCTAIGLRIAIGDLEGLLVTAIYLLIFWLQFYLIWIGLHWVRWLNGGWSALIGFVLVIWGWRDQSTIAVVFGVYSLCVGVYMALAPSVYFFAKRQRERIRWGESILVAAVLLLLVGSFAVSGTWRLSHIGDVWNATLTYSPMTLSKASLLSMTLISSSITPASSRWKPQAETKN